MQSLTVMLIASAAIETGRLRPRLDLIDLLTAENDNLIVSSVLSPLRIGSYRGKVKGFKDVCLGWCDGTRLGASWGTKGLRAEVSQTQAAIYLVPRYGHV
jgi:hypothetical protein